MPMFNAESTQAQGTQQPFTLSSIKRPRKTDTKFMVGGALPIDENGVLALPKQDRSLVNDFFEQRGVTHEFIQELLTEFFYDFLNAIETQDKAKIERMAEKRFAARLIENLDAVKAAGVKFERGTGLSQNLVKVDETDYGMLRQNLVSDIEDTYIVDNMIVKGVSSDRSQNACNFDYLKVRGHEENGILFYMHKYFAGYMHYYERLGFQKHVERILELEQILKDKDAKKEELQAKSAQRELTEKERLELELPDEELIELVQL